MSTLSTVNDVKICVDNFDVKTNVGTLKVEPDVDSFKIKTGVSTIIQTNAFDNVNTAHES